MREHWFHRNRDTLRAFVRVAFGLAWIISGSFKYRPGMGTVFLKLVADASLRMPTIFYSWFNFWLRVLSWNPTLWAWLIGTFEVLLGLLIVLGLMRRTVYIFGFVFSLLVWAVPEGLGVEFIQTPTGLGTGLIYALMFLALMVINAGLGPSHYSMDRILERRIRWWRKFAEFD